MPPCAEILWDQKTRIAAADIDFKNDTTRPEDFEIEMLMRLIRPMGFAAWRTHGGGIRIIFASRGHFDANVLAACAAARATVLEPRCTVEIKTATAHPATPRDGKRAGAINKMAPDEHLDILDACSSRGCTEEAAAAWRKERGFEINGRYDHSRCVINAKPIEGSNPVRAKRDGMLCYYCQSKTGDGFRFYGQLIGAKDQPEHPIREAARQRKPWVCTKDLYEKYYAHIPKELHQPIHRGLLWQIHGDKDDTNEVIQKIFWTENRAVGEIDPSDPLGTAFVFLQEKYTLNDSRTLRYWQEDFYEWHENRYVKAELPSIRAKIRRFLADCLIRTEAGDLIPFTPQRKNIDEVLDAVIGEVLVRGVETNRWLDLDKRERADPKYLIVFRNGLLDIRAWQSAMLLGHKPELISHSPEFFVLNCLGFDFDPTAKCENWERFLDGVFDSDPERKRVLQVFTGYVLTTNANLQKLLLMIGPRRAGKGTIIRTLKALVGEHNIAAPRLTSLSGPFGLSNLIGKQLGIFTDVHTAGRGTDLESALEILLAIVGQDPVSINRKNREILEGIILQIRFVMVMNELVQIPDHALAFASRLVVLPFRKSFVGQEDNGLTEQLAQELAGICNWSLLGVLTLNSAMEQARAAGKPTGTIIDQLFYCKEAEADWDQYYRLCSPIKTAIEDLCVLRPEHWVPTAVLYEAVKRLIEKDGRHMDSVERFGAKLVAAFPSIRKERRRFGTARHAVYTGISLRAEIVSDRWNLSLHGALADFNKATGVTYAGVIVA